MRRVFGMVVVLALLAGSLPALGQTTNKSKEASVHGKTISEWAKSLQGKELLPRAAAVNALILAGPEARSAAPALIGLFRDRDATFLHALAAVALSRIGSDALPALRKALDDDTDTVRGGAALSLGLIGPAARPAVPGLVAALKDRSDLVRQAAAQALGRVGSLARPALPALRSALDDANPVVRVEAATALWRIGGEARGAAALAATLKSDNPALARQAASALAEMGPKAKVAAGSLTEALRNKDITVRIAAAEALYRVAADVESALTALEGALAAKDAGDRRAAVAALGTLAADEKAAARLVRLLTDKDPDVRREAASALTERGDRPATVRTALETGLADIDLGVRWWCALALACSSADVRKLEEPLLYIFRSAVVTAGEAEPASKIILDVQAPARAVPALAEVLKNRTTRLKLEAARALAQLGVDPRPAQAELTEALQTDDKPLRRSAAEALGTMGTEVLATLLKWLGNPDARLREGAARALGQMGLPARQAVETLTGLLKDSEAPVRTQAALALWNIDRQAETALAALNLVLKDIDNKDRWEAVEAIGIITIEARPLIKGLLEVLFNAAKDRDIRVRLHAAKWLWRRTKQGNRVVPLLRDGVGDRDAFARITAVETLGELDAEAKAVPLVLLGLTDRDASVRLAAIEGLARGSAAIVPQLEEALKSKQPRVRLGVTQALTLMGKPATSLLQRLIADDDKAVAAAAEQGLYRGAPGKFEEMRELIQLLRQIHKLEEKQRQELIKRSDELLKKLLEEK